MGTFFDDDRGPFLGIAHFANEAQGKRFDRPAKHRHLRPPFL
jgi:hypothetical protein